MTPDQVLQTYDESYAATYDRQYLLRSDEGLIEKTHFEVDLIQKLTADAGSWLDVACGTGYFLKHARGNPLLVCMGLDLSPAMLMHARRANPDLQFINADYRTPQPELENRWDLVTCMWGAYSLQEKLSDVEVLIRNLGLWTRSAGACLMPIFDPMKLLARRNANLLRAGMSVSDDGTVWSYVEPSGKRHDHLLAPPVETVRNMFLQYFQRVEHYAYPDGADGGGLVGLIAHK